MFECSSCKKVLDEDTNFCPRCGTKQKINNKCPICLESKELLTLICGHNTCATCMNSCYREKKECPICRNKLLKQDMKSECQKKFDNILVFFIENPAFFCIGFLWLSFIKICIDINFNKKIS